MRGPLLSAILICLSTNLLASPTIFRPPDVDESVCVASSPNAALSGWSYGWNGTCGCTTEGIVSHKFAERRSVDGDVMILASPNSPSACTGSGSIFVYHKTGSEWLLETELLSPLRVPRDGFPGKVIVKGDTIVARSTWGPHATAIFRFNGSDWLEHQTILADSAENGPINWDFDGTTLAIMGATEDGFPRIRFFTPSTDGFWRQSSELIIGRDIGEVVAGNLALSSDTLVTRAIEVAADDTLVSHILVFKKGESGWVEESRFLIGETSSLGVFDPSPAISADEIVFRPFRLVRDSNGSWQRFSIEEDFPRVQRTYLSYNLSPDGNILITHQFPWASNNSSTNEIRTYALSDSDKWELVDEIVEPTATGNETRYLVNDGSTLLRKERIRTESNDLEVRVFAYSFDENGNFIEATQSTTSETCDYSSANLFDGWGWNPVTMQSCPPLEATASNNCDYSTAEQYGGWGWDPVAQTSCAPNESIVPANINETDQCDYSNSDLYNGWGWNATLGESCPPQATEELTTPSNNCVDDDNDGWGWNGNASCRVVAAQCIDPDGDGWGWDGTASCRI